MWVFVTVVHVIVSVFIIFVILLQPGKSDGMAAFAGGGGGSQTVFGGRGSVTFLSKVTSVCAIVFMLTSLALAYHSSHSDSVLRARRNLAAQDATKKPETPLAPAAPPAGAATPSQGAPKNDAPATPAPAATKTPAVPSKPAQPVKKK
jgi:preprotein translocase subunit SecG